MYILLSHIIEENIPSYRNTAYLKIRPVNQIVKGDSNNSYEVTFFNHIGTHADCQKHFIQDGKELSEYTINDFIFENVEILKIVKDKGELFNEKDFLHYENKLYRADFLIIKTDFQKYRETDKKIYQFEGPGFSKEAAIYLSRFKNLRGIGFDIVSLSSPLHREEGREAHRILLKNDKFIIVEDMNLKDLKNDIRIKRLFVLPIFIKGIDSSPVTVIAEI
jgi:arylformamidase